MNAEIPEGVFDHAPAFPRQRDQDVAAVWLDPRLATAELMCEGEHHVRAGAQPRLWRARRHAELSTAGPRCRARRPRAIESRRISVVPSAMRQPRTSR